MKDCGWTIWDSPDLGQTGASIQASFGRARSARQCLRYSALFRFHIVRFASISFFFRCLY
jgi:hypothetical protein